MEAKACYEKDQLYRAIEIINTEIKQQPQNIYKREFLYELLSIAGDLERADNQLDIIAQQEPNTILMTALSRQLIRAEHARQQCFKEGRLPEFIGKPSAALMWHLQALIEWRAGNSNKAYEYVQKAAAERLPISGECNGIAFHHLQDLDDTCASFFEVLTSNGKYYWIAYEQIKQIEFKPPVRPIDLIWRRAHMSIDNGPEGEIYIPAIYAHTQLENEAARLGHITEWMGDANKLTRGIGRRMFLLDDNTISIIEMNELIIK